MAVSVVDDEGIGVVVPHDMVLDHELWRWVPPGVTLFFTRTPHTPLPVTVEMITAISDRDAVANGVRDLLATGAGVYVYGCTSGSFVRGRSGERGLVRAMRAAGAPQALTTSGALVRALERLGVSRVAVATPYAEDFTTRLAGYLAACGLETVRSAHLGLISGIANVPYATTEDLVRRADHPDAEAVLVSCTNLPTYDVIATLESQIRKPVVTANQATMWAALHVLGRSAIGPGQLLVQR